MKKEDLLQKEVEQLLIDINFIDQYQKLSDTYPRYADHFDYRAQDILEVGEQMGIHLKRYEVHEFFADYEELGEFQFRIGLNAKYCIAEFHLWIVNEKRGINSGGSYGLLVQLLTDWRVRVKNPGFENTSELRNLLKDGFQLYDDIKKAVVERL